MYSCKQVVLFFFPLQLLSWQLLETASTNISVVNVFEDFKTIQNFLKALFNHNFIALADTVFILRPFFYQYQLDLPMLCKEMAFAVPKSLPARVSPEIPKLLV